MSLRNRLLFSIFLTLLVSLAAGAAFTYLHAVEKIETEMDAAIAVGGRIVHNAVDDAEEAIDPPRRLALIVADFDGDRHLRASFVVDGEVVKTSKLARSDRPAPQWFFDLLTGPPKVARAELPPAFTGYGGIVLETNAQNEVAEVWSDVGVTLSVMAIFCVLVLAFVFWTLQAAIRPLQDLTAAFARVGARGYHERVSERGPLELSRLYRGFNQMVERLARTEDQNKRLQEQLTTVQDEERADLARDLHDEIGPLLFAADVDVVAIEQMAEKGKYQQIPGRVRIIREAIGQMQRHVRDILGRLRPAVFLDVGLAHAIDNLVSFWRAHRPSLSFSLDLPEEGFGEQLDGTIYRVVQESLSNAVRHGDPSKIEITVKARADGTIDISVVDDGGGMKAGGRPGGYGITGMQERVASLGGELEVTNRPDGRGVAVTARVPARAGLRSAQPAPAEQEAFLQ